MRFRRFSGETVVKKIHRKMFKKKSSLELNLPQNLTAARFQRAESESEVKNIEILHPDREIEENDPYFFIRSPGYIS